jgi:hypothetical protein
MKGVCTFPDFQLDQGKILGISGAIEEISDIQIVTDFSPVSCLKLF